MSVWRSGGFRPDDPSARGGGWFDRFPSQGTFTYHRSNGVYDGVLGAGELNPALPLEATAPALCGALR